MCVERTGELQKGIVVAWKIFQSNSLGKLTYLVEPHRTLHTYPKSKWIQSGRGPGFQAFTTREDALEVLTGWKNDSWWEDKGLVVKRVRLKEYRVGTVEGMCEDSRGRKGYVAEWMMIPKG